MSWVITAVVIGTTATVYSAKQQREDGKQQQYDLDRQQEQEALAYEAEEIKRRERLNKMLAANIESAAKFGFTGEGSMKSISLETAKRVGTSEGAESLSEQLRQDLLKRQAKSARQTGNANSTATLLKGASNIAYMKK